MHVYGGFQQGQGEAPRAHAFQWKLPKLGVKTLLRRAEETLHDDRLFAEARHPFGIADTSLYSQSY